MTTPTKATQPAANAAITRRRLLAVGAVIPIASAGRAADIRGDMPWQEGQAALAPVPSNADAQQARYVFLDAAEAAFVEAAVSRLIPQDDLGPGALQAGVPFFIDRQLAGEYGSGARWYMQGPWAKGEPTQGWQTRMTPAGLYRAAIREIDAAVNGEAHAVFAKLAAPDQDAWLHRLEEGKVQLSTVEAKAFFKLLWQNTLEGFWADPMYGGNRDMAGWKLIGFPGAHYDMSAELLQHGKPYPHPPVGLRGSPQWRQG